MKQARRGLNAPRLRLILGSLLLLIAIVAGTIAFFANDRLQSYTADIRKILIDSKGSDANNTNIDTLERQLAANQPTVARAAQIVADSQSYKYQNEVVRDINAYADANNVAVTSVTFAADTATAAAAQSSGQAVTPAVNGVKPVTIAVMLEREVAYKDALSFIHAIEQNLTKMQITSLGLSAPKAGQPSSTVRIDTINLEVYLKQ